MLKMMIVDDEQWTLDGLHYQLDWRELDIEIVCEAVNGKHAIEQYEKYRPEIILSDIRMPLMDGLELSQYMQKNHPETVVVIISGYADFTYAKQAMKFGIRNFITKPIDSDELKSAMLDAKEQVKSRTIISRAQYGETVAQNDIRTWKEISEGIGLPELGYAVLMITESEPSAEDDRAIREWFCRLFPISCRIPEKTCQYVGLAKRQSDEYDRIRNEFSRLNGIVSVNGNVIIGDAFYESEQLSSLLEKMKHFGNELRFCVRNEVLSVNEIKNRIQNVPYKDISRIIDAVSGMDRKLAEERLDNIQVFLGNALEYEYRLAVHALLTGLDSIVRDISKEDDRTFKQYFEMLSEDSGSRRETIQILKNEIYTIIDELRKAAGNSSQIMIKSITRYIDKHYTEQITLEEMALKNHISPSGLSRSFKKKMGKNFNTYLRDVRMQKAEQLVRNTSLPIAEIAMSVGYDNPTYFMKVYKEIYKETPSDYRTKSQQ